ncbi:hypothetical protein DFH07DRAFT_304058 [Mycena maculata]|uniref:GST N-terminal domain-containing protein n=1 Tax=Mycena maculata TaxID=230809 RepID=A0AAD7HHQ8_9AGAR|nr:hypothetical protein DFH07DRAFT_304058 [Mycena maculata]
MATEIVFYDIPSSLPNKAWSPNTLKTRYALNYKGLAYKTVWVEYPDIESVCRQIGAAPTRNKPDGRPHFTLPMIHDPSTGATIADSAKIAAYVDATYPDRPSLMPAGTVGLHRAFEDAAHPLIGPIYPYCLPASHALLNPVSAAYFRRTREELWGKTLENLTPAGDADRVEWKKLEDGFGKMDEWIRASGEGSKYLMGDVLCYADMWMAAYLLWLKLVLPGRWGEIASWHGGRWGTLLQNLEKYETVL